MVKQPVAALTPRERRVCKMVWEGKSNREMGDMLGISVRTVEVHRANLMKKARAHNVVQLVRWAMQQKVIPR